MWRDTGLRYAPKLFVPGGLTALLFRVAVREGFEPSVQFNPYDGLANRSFRPLRHLTLFFGMAKIGVLIQLPNSICIFFFRKIIISFKMIATKKRRNHC
jgi:hypothetical protein